MSVSGKISSKKTKKIFFYIGLVDFKFQGHFGVVSLMRKIFKKCNLKVYMHVYNHGHQSVIKILYIQYHDFQKRSSQEVWESFVLFGIWYTQCAVCTVCSVHTVCSTRCAVHGVHTNRHKLWRDAWLWIEAFTWPLGFCQDSAFRFLANFLGRSRWIGK